MNNKKENFRFLFYYDKINNRGKYMNVLSICNSPDIMKIIRIVILLINIIKIVVPIILIIFLMIKIMGAVSKQNQEEIAKTIRSSIPNIIAAVLIFLVPTFVDIVARLSMPNSDYAKCISGISKEKIEKAYISKMDELVDLAEKNRTMSSYSVAKMYLSNIKDSELRQEYENRLNSIYLSIGGDDSEPTKYSEKLEILSVEVVDTVVNVKVTNSPNRVAGYYFSSIEKTPDLNGFDWIDSNQTSFRTVKYPGKYYLYAKDSAGYITPPKEVIVPEVFDVTLMHKGKKVLPVTFSTYLPRHGSSVDEFNSKIASYNKKFGLRTRESVVVGAMAFTGEIQGWGYYLPYSGSNEAISKERWGIHKYWGGSGKTFLACNPFVVWAFKQAGLNIYGNRSKIKHDLCNNPRINGKGQTEYEITVQPEGYTSKVHIYYYFVGVLGSTKTYGDNVIERHKGRSGDVLQSFPTSGHEMLIVDKYDDDNDGVSDGYIVLQSRDIGLCYEKVKYSSTTVYDMTAVYNNTATFAEYLNGWTDYYIPESDYPSYLR